MPNRNAVANNGNAAVADPAFEHKLRAENTGVPGWTNATRPRLMISYSHADQLQAEHIARRLSSRFKILIDKRNFVLSQSTRPEMERLVGEADLVLVLFSPDSVVSGGVRFEMDCALKREKDELRKVLFAAMIRKCKPMPEWPSERLYANVHSGETLEFSKLVRSMINASKRVVPKAEATSSSDQLRGAAVASMPKFGFVVRREVKILSRGDEEDDALTAQVVNVDNACYYSAYIVTYLGWTLVFYFPQIALNGRRESQFAHDRFATRSQVGSRLGGYISYLKQHRNTRKDPMLDDLIKVVKRHKKVVDVVLSPHTIGQRFAQTGDVQRLTWPNAKGVMFFHQKQAHVDATALPIFLAPTLRNSEELSDAMRCLKAALRLELERHGAIASTWQFLEPRVHWRSLGRSFRNRRHRD